MRVNYDKGVYSVSDETPTKGHRSLVNAILMINYNMTLEQVKRIDWDIRLHLCEMAMRFENGQRDEELPSSE